MIDSHVYIPRTILKAFATKNNSSWRAFYIKLPITTIKEGDINRVNTQSGEYDHRTENILNQEYESGIAALNIIVAKSLRNKNGCVFSNSNFNIDTIKKYFVFQMIRDEAIIRTIYPNLSAKDLRQLKNDLVQKEASDRIIEETFKGYGLIICVNPSGNLIGCNFPISIPAPDGQEIFAMPISPYILLVLTNDFQKALPLKYVQKAHCEIPSNFAKQLNSQIVIVGKKKGLGYIFSKDKKTLEEALGQKSKS